MPAISLGRQEKLPKDHPFYGGRIISAPKPPKGWKEKVAVSSSKTRIDELKSKGKLSLQDEKLLESYKKELSQAEYTRKIVPSAEKAQPGAGDRLMKKETSGSPTGGEPKDSDS